MKKIAFFVEGRTECNFIIKLIEEAYDRKEISITANKAKGGNKAEITFTTIFADSIKTDTKFHVLIVNCTGESNLRTYIDDRREDLTKSGFFKIIGIRDLYPNFQRNELHTLMQGLKYKLPQKPIETEFIINIMELETNFLSEHNHFSVINPNLTTALISDHLGFNPETDDMQVRPAPSLDLHNCYSLVNESYSKEDAVVDRTISSLDYSNIYYNLRTRIQPLDRLIQNLDDFFH
ncbi:MAG: hypothetical protein JNK73_06180 [Bacteroidia bacterium]|nr:hypothetical protein [Bacteroidia bacterium]